MNEPVAEHPTPAQLRAFAEGKLAPDAFAALEAHIAACESCCRALESVPPDSFVDRLKVAEQVGVATTCDGPAGMLVEVAGVPPELTDHPRYRVLALVGQGGMGAVYKAEHRRMDRLVALKVINPGLLTNPATVSRFQHEVRIAAQLSHPNIVTAHDADQAGGLHFLVMEYVEGKSLADIIQERGQLPAAEACEYVRQAALGLQHAHERGMVHRDVKPQNLMVTPTGAVKILDFGLARFACTPDEPQGASTPTTTPGLTRQGTVMGTADYVAPEQIADPRTADIRADIYALGCTLYHLLTGEPPFPQGTAADKYKQHAETPTVLPKEWPAELKAIVAKMTAKKLEERYVTPAEVAEALRRAGGVSDGRKRSSGRSRARLAVAALFSLAALIVAAIILHIQTDKGVVVIQTDDPALEIVTGKGGEIVRIRDPQSGQTWELDAKNLTMRDLEHPDGLVLEVPWRGKLTFKSAGGKVAVTTGPKGVEAVAEQPKPIRVVDPVRIREFEAEAEAVQKKADAEIQSRRDKLLVDLQAMVESYTKAGKVDEAVVIRDRIRLLKVARQRAQDLVAHAKDKPRNLLVNGSFEEGPPLPENGVHNVPFEAGSTAIKGWVVTRRGGGVWDYTYFQPLDGKRMGGATGRCAAAPDCGAISQTFKTRSGQKYRVSFWLAGDAITKHGEKRLQVSAAGNSAEFVFDTTGKTRQDMGWVRKTWEFTAEADATTLEFAALTDGMFGGVVFDDVVVVAVDE